MRVIGTVGLAGSGKGVIASVADELGIPVITMGDVIREECRARGLDPAEHHGDVARALRKEEGPTAIAKRTLPRIDNALESNDVVVIDGIRSDVEVDVFEEHFGETFELIRIDAPFELRASRLQERSRDETDGAAGLQARDAREREFGLDAAMAQADYSIDNTSTLAAFEQKARDLLNNDLPD